jgi:flagellar hook-length control protein FliK
LLNTRQILVRLESVHALRRCSDFPSLAEGSGAASDDSIVVADFAALLLGQLAGNVDAGQAAFAGEQPESIVAESLTNPTDPALLLAAMGIAVPADMASRLAESNLRPIDTALLAAQNRNDGQMAAAATELQAGAAGEQSATDLLARINSNSDRASGMALLAESPAKLAGFEQKLAESTQPLTELSGSAPQPVNAAQFGVNAANARQTGGEHLQIDTPLKSQTWPSELGQKIVWLTAQEKQSAQITLNPPQLGPIEITLNVKNDQATAMFMSANADVRAAIEAAMPRLREMLEGVGVELGQTNVSAESFRQSANDTAQERDRRGDDQGSRGGLVDQGISAALTGAAVERGGVRGRGLVDTFA